MGEESIVGYLIFCVWESGEVKVAEGEAIFPRGEHAAAVSIADGLTKRSREVGLGDEYIVAAVAMDSNERGEWCHAPATEYA